MTKEEYEKELRKINERRDKDLGELMREYALSNNPYKIGDIIQDHIGKGRIVEILITYASTYWEPCCKYKCENLTKKGTVNKVTPFRMIYQENIISDTKKED